MTVEPIYITWLNNVGGFEYFLFTGRKESHVDVDDSSQTKTNVFINWPNSYGQFADTVDRQTFRSSREAMVVKSQHLTRNQLDAITQIRTSPLVQILYSRNDRVTVLVDTDSFKKYDEVDTLYTIQFRIRFTNELPSQAL